MSIEPSARTDPAASRPVRPAARPSVPLARDDFRNAVAMLPLVSLDLLVRNHLGQYLLGLRANPPARGTWFVPGGRIRKNETLHAALRRLARQELGLAPGACLWHPRGIYEHFYDTNFAGDTDSSTHYVVLAYETALATEALSFPIGQHRHYRWMPPPAIGADPLVHPYTKAYFRESGP